MNKEKHQRLLNNQKFDAVTFALDYIQEMKNFTGEITRQDHITCLERLYDVAFREGQMDILHRYVYSMFHEIDAIEDKING